ncbi:COG4705 family protein [Pedobacter arcticus]|uniref:COG4705 family protein n=1 Tax=Pedobacter arcticus TaxID=752140 RepID=UPI00031DD09C|nr:hypothetical protein [Pedobacter arcticus]
MEKLNKVAQITLLFWVMKILSTTLGETLGDLLSMTLNLGYGIGLLATGLGFAVALFFQLNAKKFYPALYWLVITGTTTLGTEISDFMDRTLKLGYVLGSLILFVGLLLALLTWFKTEGNLAVYPIKKKRVEIFYWVAILFSNSLGTAFGDFLSDNLNLGYGYGALLTAGIIAIVIAVHYFTKVNEIILFWIAFIFTRPFGATFGDLLTKPTTKGGLDLGTIPATCVSATLIILLVIYSHKKSVKQTSNL